MEKELIRFLPKMEEIEALGLHNNCTSLISSTVDVEEVFAKETQSEYEQFLADVWVGIILTLIVLSCVCCMCSCLLYHKFQQWKRSILETRSTANLESGNPECESLPSYTIASGLPSYQEALEQLQKVKELTKTPNKGAENVPDIWTPHTPPTPMSRLSVSELFQIYKSPNPDPGLKT